MCWKCLSENQLLLEHEIKYIVKNGIVLKNIPSPIMLIALHNMLKIHEDIDHPDIYDAAQDYIEFIEKVKWEIQDPSKRYSKSHNEKLKEKLKWHNTIIQVLTDATEGEFHDSDFSDVDIPPKKRLEIVRYRGPLDRYINNYGYSYRRDDVQSLNKADREFNESMTIIVDAFEAAFAKSSYYCGYHYSSEDDDEYPESSDDSN